MSGMLRESEPWGTLIAFEWAAGLRQHADYAQSSARAMQVIGWRLAEHFAERQAEYAEWHARWYCALPWPKRWLAMVLGL